MTCPDGSYCGSILVAAEEKELDKLLKLTMGEDPKVL